MVRLSLFSPAQIGAHGNGGSTRKSVFTRRSLFFAGKPFAGDGAGDGVPPLMTQKTKKPGSLRRLNTRFGGSASRRRARQGSTAGQGMMHLMDAKKMLEFDDAVVNRPWYVVDPRTQMMMRWDMVTAMALVWTAIATPYEVAFLASADTAADFLFITNRMIDLVFVLDMRERDPNSQSPDRAPPDQEIDTSHRLNGQSPSLTSCITHAAGASPSC